MKSFSEHIIYWYQLKKRDLPWRNTKDPFKIWLSEIILQQTRVKQGLDYYLRFTERFKNVNSLAEASEEEVLKLWQGLGYYSRARNLHFAARQIVNDHMGKFPEKHIDLLKIKGIGEYSAAAIASLAFGLPYPVLDGNVYRVMARYALIEDAVNSSTGKKKINAILNTLIDKDEPGTFNQALMELGAMVCTPKNPKCNECPLSLDCQAFNKDKTDVFPVKALKEAPQNRYFQYIMLLFQKDNIWFTLIKQRKPGDIWAGLYEFPLIETDHQLTEDEIKEQKEFQCLINESSYDSIYYSPSIHHQLTHRNIHCCFWMISLKENSLNVDNKVFKVIQLNDLFKYPISRLIDRFLSISLINNMIQDKIKKV